MEINTNSCSLLQTRHRVSHFMMSSSVARKTSLKSSLYNGSPSEELKASLLQVLWKEHSVSQHSVSDNTPSISHYNKYLRELATAIRFLIMSI